MTKVFRSSVFLVIVSLMCTSAAFSNMKWPVKPVRMGAIIVKNASSVPALVDLVEGSGQHGVFSRETFCLVSGASKTKETYTRTGVSAGDSYFLVHAHIRPNGCDVQFTLKTLEAPMTQLAGAPDGFNTLQLKGFIRNKHEVLIEGHDEKSMRVRVITSYMKVSN